MKHIRLHFRTMLEGIFLSTANRLSTQLRLFCLAIGTIACIMTALNIIKSEYILGFETAVGAVVSLIIYIIITKTKNYFICSVCMSLFLLAILTTFLVSGSVEGFAALWFCLYPFACLFILDIKPALLFIAVGLGILTASLWTPLNSMLPPVYTENFMLRFPLLYTGNFAVAIALNGFYSYTYNSLLEMKKKFERLSTLDGLTKLANRNYLDTYKLTILERQKTTVSAIIIDADYFKQYNDTYGHLAGDEVLKTISRQMQELLLDREALAIRYGGEEFLILAPDCSSEKAACLAEALRKSIYDLQIPHQAAGGFLSVSIGVSSRMVESQNDFDLLINASDSALYTAKQTGRNRVVVK